MLYNCSVLLPERQHTDISIETFFFSQIIWPSDVKSQLIGRDPDARKDRGQEKRVTEDEMVG